MVNNLCLGTAQFGMNYGITNANGKINDKDINPILDLVFKEGKPCLILLMGMVRQKKF